MRATSRFYAVLAQLRIDCFEINRWPALASHLMAFFLGVVSLNQAQSRADGPKSVPRRTVLIRPSFAMEEEMKGMNGAAALDIVMKRKDGEACRVNHGELVLVAIHGETLLKVAYGDMKDIGSLLKVLLGEKQRDIHF